MKKNHLSLYILKEILPILLIGMMVFTILHFSVLWKIGPPFSPALLVDPYPAFGPRWNLRPDEHPTIKAEG
jgi:hypothetical protein